MTLLSRNFRLLSLTGLWKPTEWKSWKAQLYNLYTFIVAFANFSFVVSGIMAIDIKNSTLAVIVDNVSLTLAAVNACGKLFCAVFSRKYILEVINCLQNKPFTPQDREEVMIYNKFDRYANLVQSINIIFSQVIFLQYAISSLILCTIAKVLTSTPLFSMDFVGNLLFFLAMAKQIFFQCYTVNQMIIEFSDITTTLYNTNWFQLSKNIQKSVIIILAKTAKPVVFSSGYFITLSLESFTKIIKFSYTIYNVLE
ncbi:putative odorant receptor 19b [Chelonus insularis]|uniref:putative odorant receptor 19b n=1 Tax=Chelonus insularis TaxID=460826 RepID=UPI00158B4196|nr:putative odorant receptor 19b [Chelonus insularis]